MDSIFAAVKKNTARRPRPKRQRISLRYYFPFAGVVRISGSFNDWTDLGLPLHRNGEGYWVIELEILPGRYEFRLIVDGAWTDVPDAIDTVENSFGTRNAVLTIGALVNSSDAQP